jgi:hypothetical protein
VRVRVCMRVCGVRVCVFPGGADVRKHFIG